MLFRSHPVIQNEGVLFFRLVELLQDGKIGHLHFVLQGENAQDFLDWCRSHGTDPTDESAEFYIEQTEIDVMERQALNDEDYGVWN